MRLRVLDGVYSGDGVLSRLWQAAPGMGEMMPADLLPLPEIERRLRAAFPDEEAVNTWIPRWGIRTIKQRADFYQRLRNGAAIMLTREVARMLEEQREVDAKIADHAAAEHTVTAAAWRSANLPGWEDQAPDYERRRAVAEEIAAAIRSQR